MLDCAPLECSFYIFDSVPFHAIPYHSVQLNWILFCSSTRLSVQYKRNLWNGFPHEMVTILCYLLSCIYCWYCLNWQTCSAISKTRKTRKTSKTFNFMEILSKIELNWAELNWMNALSKEFSHQPAEIPIINEERSFRVWTLINSCWFAKIVRIYCHLVGYFRGNSGQKDFLYKDYIFHLGSVGKLIKLQ